MWTEEGEESPEMPLTSGGGLFGFAMVIADFVTDLAAMAFARARWWGDREDRTILVTDENKEKKKEKLIPTHLAFEQLLLPMLRHDLAVGAGWGSLAVGMLGVGCAIGWGRVMGQRVVVVVLEGMRERMVRGMMLKGIHCAIGVEGIARRRGRADGGLSAGRDEDGVVGPGPRRLVVWVCEFVVDSGGLLRIVHGMSRKRMRVWQRLSESKMGQ